MPKEMGGMPLTYQQVGSKGSERAKGERCRTKASGIFEENGKGIRRVGVSRDEFQTRTNTISQLRM